MHNAVRVADVRWKTPNLHHADKANMWMVIGYRRGYVRATPVEAVRLALPMMIESLPDVYAHCLALLQSTFRGLEGVTYLHVRNP